MAGWVPARRAESRGSPASMAPSPGASLSRCLPRGAAGGPAPRRGTRLRSGFPSARRGGAGRDVTGAPREERPVSAARGAGARGAMAAGYQQRPNGGAPGALPDPSFLWSVFQR